MNWIKRHKFLAAIGVFLLCSGLVNLVKHDTPVSPKNSIRSPKYEVVDTYGRNCMVIVISSNETTDESLVAIGKALNEKFGEDQFVRIGIFTDRTQAKLMSTGKAPDLTGVAAKKYDNAYVAQFNINQNTGHKRFLVTRDGKNIDFTERLK